MPTETFYVLELHADGCQAEFWLNDLAVIRRGEGLGEDYTGQCNHQLVPGRNELTVVIQPGPRPSAALTGAPARGRQVLGQATVRAELSSYPYGALAGDPKVRTPLIQMEWQSPDDGRPRFWPQVLAASTDLGQLWGPPAWLEAPRLRLDSRTRNEVHRFLVELRASLESRDWETFFRRSRPRLTHIERAYQLPAGSKERQFRELFARESTQEGWGFRPLDPGGYDLRLAGGGRLVECVGGDWAPALQEHPLGPNEQQAQYDMLLARLDDAWAIVG